MFCADHAVLSGLRSAHPRPGERIAVLGVGGLGHLAVQLSRALGFTTLALTGQPDKAPELRRLGADEVVVVGEEPGPALAAAGGADVVLSTTDSGRQVRSVLEALQPGGRLVDMGVTDGPTGRWCMAPGRWLHASLRRRSEEPASLLTDNWLADDGSVWEREHVAQALRLVAAGKVKPAIETYRLAEVNAVRERLAARQVRFSAVLLH
jgi:D-arabinose 1-dehydrogenase-like Zn-dependent alcohol dehydrogenase